MSKRSKITNLLVVPLIGSAIFLANPVLANNPTHHSRTEVRHKTNIETPRKGIAGVVTSISGSIIVVTTKDNIQYTVDASSANIMRASNESSANPSLITTSDIKIGDSIIVRGEINNTEINADMIFEGEISHRHSKHHRDAKHLMRNRHLR